MNSAWQRTCRDKPCPICGKSDWCLVSANRSVVICPRVETGAVKYLDGSGYLHVIDKSAPIPPRKDELGVELPEHNIVLSSLASRMMASCDDERLKALSDSLGIPSFALRLMRVGWFRSSDAYSFPMWRAGKRLIGIRLRSLAGKKWAIKGSRQGLFMPDQWPRPGMGILICEGPTDTAAMLSLGFNAIGRPSATGNHELVAEAVSGHDACIVADSDKVGTDTANRLADYLVRSESCKSVKLIVPNAKDAREWVRCGATRRTVSTSIALAEDFCGRSRFQSTSSR